MLKVHESPLASFEWAWLRAIALQTPLDRALGELPFDARTLISHWEKFRGKTGKILRSVIAINRLKFS